MLRLSAGFRHSHRRGPIEARCQTPFQPPATFPQLIGDPGDAIETDDEIGRRPPEAARVICAKEFARFANADHGARLIGREKPPTFPTAEASGVSGAHGIAHNSERKRL